MLEEIHTVATAGGDMAVLVKTPDPSAALPVVVLFHDGPGVREATHEVIRRIAAEGYYVAAPDRYHRAGRFRHIDPALLRTMPADDPRRKEFGALLFGTTDDMVRDDLRSLLGHVAAQPAARPAPMGVIGYCVGAKSAMHAAHDHPDVFAAAVGMHPSFCTTDAADSPHTYAASLAADVYVAFGSDDRMQSAADNAPFIAAVRALGPHGRADVLDGADHGFAVPGPSYHEASADTAYAAAFERFARALR